MKPPIAIEPPDVTWGRDSAASRWCACPAAGGQVVVFDDGSWSFEGRGGLPTGHGRANTPSAAKLRALLVYAAAVTSFADELPIEFEAIVRELAASVRDSDREQLADRARALLEPRTRVVRTFVRVIEWIENSMGEENGAAIARAIRAGHCEWALELLKGGVST